MGVATALNFQPTGNGKAAITGDFVLLGSEVNPVIKALRQNGIAVTALHSHMLMEEPRLFFMEGYDSAGKLIKRFEVVSAQKIEDRWYLKQMRVEKKDPQSGRVMARTYLEIKK